MAEANVIGGNRLTSGQIQVVPASDITGKLAESSIANDNTGTLVDIINVDSSTKQVSASKLASIPESKLSNDNSGNIASVINSDTSSTTINSGKLGSIPGSKLTGSVASSLLSGTIASSLLPFIFSQTQSRSHGLFFENTSNVGPNVFNITTGSSGYFDCIILIESNGTSVTTSDIKTSASTINVTLLNSTPSGNPSFYIFMAEIASGSPTTGYTLTIGTTTTVGSIVLGSGF